jgi:hypothetical protein
MSLPWTPYSGAGRGGGGVGRGAAVGAYGGLGADFGSWGQCFRFFNTICVVTRAQQIQYLPNVTNTFQPDITKIDCCVKMFGL